MPPDTLEMTVFYHSTDAPWPPPPPNRKILCNTLLILLATLVEGAGHETIEWTKVGDQYTYHELQELGYYDLTSTMLSVSLG